MLDHVSLRVQDFPRAVAFYRAALAPIGYEVLMEFPDAAGLGAGGKPDLWLTTTSDHTHPMHIALAGARAAIDAFHAAALEAGGVDNGPPGLRPDYHPHYYAAYIHDPEGNNIEVVCHDDPAASPGNAPRPAAKKRTLPPARKTSGKTAGPAKSNAKKTTRSLVKKATKAGAKAGAKTAAKTGTKVGSKKVTAKTASKGAPVARKRRIVGRTPAKRR